jgi:hypothetical protein
MKRFQSILCVSLLTLALAPAAFGKVGDITGSPTTKPGDITGKPGDITGQPGDITGLLIGDITGLLIDVLAS